MISRRSVLTLAAAASAAAITEATAHPLSGARGGDSGGPRVTVREVPVDETTMSIGDPVSIRGEHRRLLLCPPVQAGPFSMVGLTWAGGSVAQGPPLNLSVRTGSGGQWAEWRELHRDTDAPDAGGPDQERPDTVCAAPVWTGAAEALQIRVDLPAGMSVPIGMRAVLIDPGTTAADGDPSAPSPVPDPLPTPIPGLLRPVVRTRKEWGANPRLQRRRPRYTSPLRAGFVHHTAGTNVYEAADVPRILRGIQAYHVRTRGWSDVGYNLFVDKFGRIWEGRAGGVDKRVLGAHTGGFNGGTFGIAALGDFQRAQPTPALVSALAQVLSWKFALDGAPGFDPSGTVRLRSAGGGVARYRAGTTVAFDTISGHRDAGLTSCPGRNLYAQLPLLRTLVAAAIAEGGGAAAVGRLT